MGYFISNFSTIYSIVPFGADGKTGKCISDRKVVRVAEEIDEIRSVLPTIIDQKEMGLDKVVGHYSRGGVKNPFLDNQIIPLNLTESEKRDIVEMCALSTVKDGSISRLQRRFRSELTCPDKLFSEDEQDGKPSRRWKG